jgi:acyl-CoA thioesterase-1
MSLLINEGDLILFQGDSITDAGRNHENNDDLGKGYANLIAAWFSALYPEKKVSFINRGIGGNTVENLQARWKTDCLELKPSWVSIMIGINDCWRRYDSNNPTSVDTFENKYRDILTQTKENLNAKIILCEPFVLPFPEERKKWREDLDPKIQVVRNLAREFNAPFVPCDGLFAQACTKRDPEFWSNDGVHPSQAGHALIAQMWLKTMGVL